MAERTVVPMSPDGRLYLAVCFVEAALKRLIFLLERPESWVTDVPAEVRRASADATAYVDALMNASTEEASPTVRTWIGELKAKLSTMEIIHDDAESLRRATDPVATIGFAIIRHKLQASTMRAQAPCGYEFVSFS